MYRAFALGGAAALTLLLGVAAPRADEPQVPGRAPANIDIEEVLAGASGRAVSFGVGGAGGRFRDFAELTKGAEKTEGLFTVHKKDEHLYAEIKPFQFDQPLLMPVTIARGMGQAGMPLGDDDEMVLVFHKAGDKVQLIRRNIHYKAPAGTPIDKSVKQGLCRLDPDGPADRGHEPAGGMSTVIDLSDIFLTDFAQLGLGYDGQASGSELAPGQGVSQATWSSRSRPTFTGGGRGSRDGRRATAWPTTRGVTVVIHYSLMKAPDGGYTRLAHGRRPRGALSE